jgi:hypothetical protein
MVQKNGETEIDLKTSYDEGLGTVYERFRLNYIFRDILQKYDIKSILEYPIYGMTGVDGINSVYFAQQGLGVDLVDCDQQRLEKIRGYWQLLGLEDKLATHYVSVSDMSKPDLPENSYDLVWNFAALWFYQPDDRSFPESGHDLSQ